MQTARFEGMRRHQLWIAICAATILTVTPAIVGQEPAASRTLGRVRETGRINLGYLVDTRPFSYRDDRGRPNGYSVSLCRTIVEGVTRESGRHGLAVEWVPVRLDERFGAVKQGRVDVLCGADSVTVGRRADVAFSIPIFPGGIARWCSSDASASLRNLLAVRSEPVAPTWRAAATQSLKTRAFAVVRGTTAEQWLSQRFKDFGIIAEISAPVGGYDAGIRALLNGWPTSSSSTARSRSTQPHGLRLSRSVFIDRRFTYEALALALPRGDNDFRLLVDRTLSRFYRSRASPRCTRGRSVNPTNTPSPFSCGTPWRTDTSRDRSQARHDSSERETSRPASWHLS